jgi:DNA-binding transcriptional ArsR family regulator
VHAFDVLGDPVRRRLVELLAEGERTAGDLTERVQSEFGITQPAVSRHLRVLRDAGFATSEVQAQRRLYRLRPEPLAEVDAWLARYRSLWSQALDALDTELHRGRRAAAHPRADEEGPS